MMATPIVDEFLEDDEFYDADDGRHINSVVSCGDTNSESQPMTLERSLQDCMVAVKFFFNNEFDQAIELLRPWRDCSIYHAMGYGTMTYLRAIMTFDPLDIAEAGTVLRESLLVCSKARRVASIPESVTKIIMKTSYKDYTELECHAELCYAECLLLRAVLNVLEDESFLSLVRGGLKIKTCFSCYKECLRMLKSRNWDLSTTRHHFEGGVKLGAGTFNLLISQLPARVLQILEFVGLSGSKELGLNDLEATFGDRDNIHCSLAALVVLGYHLIACTVMGTVSEPELQYCSQVLERELHCYPNSALFLFFAGRLHMVQCELREAEIWYKRSFSSQCKWPQLGHICYWELFWCRVFQRDWLEAADYAGCLMRESRWSRTICSYLRAACLLMIDRHSGVGESDFDESSASRREEISELMRTLPDYKQRIAGKSLSMEKLVIAKAQWFKKSEEAGGTGGPALAIPGFELMYLWNCFSIISKQRNMIEAIFLDIEREMKAMKIDTGVSLESSSASDWACSPECGAVLLLLHGVCLSHLDSPLRAEHSLLRVTELQSQLRRDVYLVPFAWLEVALLRCHQAGGRTPEITRLLQHAKNDFKRYPMENRLHFRVHYILNTMASLK